MSEDDEKREEKILSICKEMMFVCANFHISIASGRFFCSIMFLGRQYCNTAADVCILATNTITNEKILTFWPWCYFARGERSIPISIFPKVELESSSRGIRTKFLHQTHTHTLLLRSSRPWNSIPINALAAEAKEDQPMLLPRRKSKAICSRKLFF